MLFMPFYLIKMSILTGDEPSNPISNLLKYENSLDTLKYFGIGSVYMFLYRFYSVSFLLSYKSELYSFFNMLRIFFILSLSIMIYSYELSKLQSIGIIIINFGILFNSFLNLRYEPMTAIVPNFRREFFKKFILGVLSIIILASFFFETVHIKSNQYNNSVNSNNNQNRFYLIKSKSKHNVKVNCVNKIREDLINAFRNLIPNNNLAVLLDIPNQDFTDDSILW